MKWIQRADKINARIERGFAQHSYYMPQYGEELFARYLRTNTKTKKIVEELRKEIIRIPRWPELTTFEEMNLSPPKMKFWQKMGPYFQSESIKKFLA